MSQWNQFLRTHQGQGKTISQLSQMYKYQHGGGNPEQIWIKYHKDERFSKRLSSDSSITRLGLVTPTRYVDLEAVKLKFFASDPTSNKKYLDWILDGYLHGGNHMLEDVMSQMPSALRKFIHLRDTKKFTGQEGNILGYCGLFGCQKKTAQPGLLTLLERFPDIIPVRTQRTQIKTGAEVVYEDSFITIIHPTTQEASCLYGKGTRWCTTSQTAENMFKLYNQSGPLYIILPKDPISRKKYQLHFLDGQFMDETDTPVKLSDFPYTESIINFIRQLPPGIEANPTPTLIYLLLKSGRMNPQVILEGVPLVIFVTIGGKWGYEWDDEDEYEYANEIIEILKFLIEQGVDLNTQDSEGNTALHVANNSTIVKFLIEHGVNMNHLNRKRQNPLYGKLPEIYQLLIDRGANPHIVDINGRRPLPGRRNNEEIIRATLDTNPMVLKSLLQTTDINLPDMFDLYPLHSAQTLESITKLLLVGADPNVQTKIEGVTPLHMWTTNYVVTHRDLAEKLAVVSVLIDGGANPNIPDNSGSTPLHRAISLDIAKYLMDNGADPTIENHSKLLPCETTQFPVNEYIRERMSCQIRMGEFHHRINVYIRQFNRAKTKDQRSERLRQLYDILSTPKGHQYLEEDKMSKHFIRYILDEQVKADSSFNQYYSTVFGAPPTIPRSQQGGRDVGSWR